MVICQKQGANDLHTAQLMPPPPHQLLLIQISLTCLVRAYPGCPGKEDVKRVSTVVTALCYTDRAMPDSCIRCVVTGSFFDHKLFAGSLEFNSTAVQ